MMESTLNRLQWTSFKPSALAQKAVYDASSVTAHTGCRLFKVACMLVAIGFVSGQAAKADEGKVADPTQLSPQITELLSQLQPPAVPAAEDVPKDADQKQKEEPFLVRLKGIVMRDSEQGSALLAIDKDQYIRIPLKRANARDEPHQLSLNGMNYEIESFSSSALKLKNMSNGQVLIIN